MWFLLMDAEECIEELRRYARALEKTIADRAADAVTKRRAVMDEDGEPTKDEKMEDLLWASYLGLRVLRTMCKKTDLKIGVETADRIIEQIETLRPDYVPRTALRPKLIKRGGDNE